MADPIELARKTWACVIALVLVGCIGSGRTADAGDDTQSVSALRHAIVFTRYLPDQDQGNLYRIDQGGTAEHLIRSVNDFAILSPSGTQFLDFAPTADDRASTAVFDVDGTGYHVLPLGDPSLDLPGGQWSAGDARIASEGWARDGDPRGVSIYSRRVSDGGGLIRLTDAASRHDYPVKSSPNGSKLLFFRPDAPDETDDSAPQDVYVVGAHGGRQQRLNPPGTTTAFVFSGDSVSWSPSGSEIAQVLSHGAFWHNSQRSSYIARVDGSGLQRIGPKGDIWDAVWSPDGQWIAFTMATAESGGLHELFLMHPDGSELHPLVSSEDGLFSVQPIWSPESEQLLFMRGDQQLFEGGPDDPHIVDLWSIDVDGSGMHQIKQTPGGYGGVAFLPGG